MPKPRVPRREVTQPSDPSYKIIALTQGQSTMVDTADYPWLNQWPWYARWSTITKSFYALRNSTTKEGAGDTIYMAREILDCGPNEEADHWNHDTLDNRRENLRKATYSQNKSNQKIYSNNTSGYKGVSWHKKCERWRVDITWQGKRIYLGLFSSLEEAVRVRDEAAKKLHGEFASLNLQK